MWKQKNEIQAAPLTDMLTKYVGIVSHTSRFSRPAVLARNACSALSIP